MAGIYELTLRAPDGQERRMLAWLPTEAIRQDFYEKARQNGISIVESSSQAKRAELERKVES